MKKVKITKVPSMAWGGRIFNQVAPNALPYQTDEDMMHYNDTLQPVDRDEANLEAEKDEEVVIPNYKGMSTKFRVGGKRHSEGGTPLNLPDDSFVFSDTRAMKLNDPELLKQFGKPAKKGGYTPAELAKPYDINKYRKVLDDPMSDPIQKKTAEEMIANYNVLLGKLALAQEAKKGFPQGIPFISEPYLMMNNLTPEDILPMDSFAGDMMQQEQPQVAKYGGAKKVKIKQLPKAQTGFQAPWQKTMDMLNPKNYPINPATGKAEFKPQSQTADPNEGQIIPPGSHFSDTDRGFLDKVGDALKPKTGMEAFARRQVIKRGITDLLNSRDDEDPMLAYRTMEDTMTAIPTSKGTFDPLNKNNFPYKNDYATYDPFTYSTKYGGELPHAQVGLQTASDSLNYQLNKIADYEYARGSDMGTGLPNYGNKRLKNPTKQQAVDWITQNVVPNVSPYFTSPTEQAEATDFLYNTGRDPRIYMLDQYLQSIGQKGLPNRPSFNIDSTKPEHASAWKTKKAELDKLWKQHEKDINGLSENDRRILLNKGRDSYYRNINVKPDGSPSDAYYNTWYGRIWNTNDYTPFDPNNPKFTPKKKKYGGDLPKGQFGPQVVSAIPGMIPANPMVHPFNDPLTQNIATYRDPKTLPPANNLMIQNALDQQAQAAAAATSLQNQTNQSAKSSSAKRNTSSRGPASATSSTGDLVSFNQDFWNEYDTLGQSGAFVYDPPAINFKDPKERERKATQAAQKDKNIYGDLEWNKGQEWDDFTRRHQWYLKDHPDFDPTDMDDVKDFQTQYCSRAAAFGMKSCYFLKDGKSGTGFDGKFGEHTWSAPGFNTPVEQPTEQKTEKETKQEDIKTNPLEQPPYYNPYEYYPQDVLNLMTGMLSQIPDPKTFYSNLAWQAYSPAYIKEDYSPIMEAANIATQGIGAYGSRQSADASYSGIQGKAARQAADHNLQVANLNVGIYNDAEKFNAQTREKNYMYNQMQKQQNFDTEQAYMADRIKAKNEKRANVAALYNQMITNAVDTYNLNAMNPNYKILPGTGGRVAFVNPEMLKPNKDALTNPRVREYEGLRESGYTHDQAIDIIGRQSSKAAYPQQQQYPYSNPYDYMTGLNYYEQ